MLQVDRRQVLAHRAAVQGLHRQSGAVQQLPVLDLGVQDTPPGSAPQALAVRLGHEPPRLEEDGRLALTWTFRGAPHIQRAEDLLPLSRALWPISDDDAVARLDTSASPVRSTGMAPRDALRFVAEQLADIVTQPMFKGEASAAVTRRIPAELTVDCRACKATHIVETLFRTAVLPAGIAFVPGRRGVVFAPLADWPGVPTEPARTGDLLRAYLHLHGPANLVEASAFLGARARDLERFMPADVVDVEVAGGNGRRRSTLALASDLEALRHPPDPPPLRLLPPSDPFLQARDRDVVVPDEGQRKRLWPMLGRPGALLAAGEVAGIWRARKVGRRLEVSIEPFGRLLPAAQRHLNAEAALIAAARNATSVAVH